MFRMRFTWLRSAGILSAIAFGVVSSAQAVLADDHLPIIDIVPIATWAGAANAQGTPTNPLVSGTTWLTGTATLPLVKHLTFSFDRLQGDLIGNPLVPGGTFNDIIDDYRLDYSDHPFTFEVSLANRHRVCCPGSADPFGAPSTEWHTGNFGITYATPSLGKGLGNSFLVLNVTGHTANHDPGSVEAASQGGLDITCPVINTSTTPATCANYSAKREFGTSQAATLVVPVDGAHGFVTTATYVFGDLDYFEDAPYPWFYKIWVFAAEKHFNPYFSLKATESNLWQAPQGTPFPTSASEVIHEASWTLSADFHIDFNKLVH